MLRQEKDQLQTLIEGRDFSLTESLRGKIQPFLITLSNIYYIEYLRHRKDGFGVLHCTYVRMYSRAVFWQTARVARRTCIISCNSPVPYS